MSENEHQQHVEHEENRNKLSLDSIVASQPELGPSIPDGSYGWIVFAATVFFQILIPSLAVSFGIFVAFSILENFTPDDTRLKLWDEKIVYVPLFFSITAAISDPYNRLLVTTSTSPRLVGTAGTCLLCAGLLFMWMGMTGNGSGSLLGILAGSLSGYGASLQMAQCEILLSQYFRIKLPTLNQISKAFMALGFLISPVILGHNIIKTSLLHVILWYQAILLQGLIVNMFFKKPPYMKAKQKTYRFMSQISNPDDEEDVFSKNSRELQIKRSTSSESGHGHVTTIEIQPIPSTSAKNADEPERQSWEKFEDEEEEIKYDKLKDWETFEEDESGLGIHAAMNCQNLAEEMKNAVPSPLFSDMPVNNNNTYAYDDEIRVDSANSNVFMPPNVMTRQTNLNFRHNLLLFKEPSFYKSLLMVVTNRYSLFIFYTFFPGYMYAEVKHTHITQVASFTGALSLVTFLYLTVSYWIKIDKVKRPLGFWILCWIGTVGYFMLSDHTSPYILLIGAVMVVLSINCLQHIGGSLLGITFRGETSREHCLLNILSGISLLILLLINITVKDCFRVMAVLHFFVGTLWLSNYVYKRIRVT